MSYKPDATCLMSMITIVVLLFWLPATSQYNFNGLDAQLERSKKLFGGGVVMMVHKDDSLIYKKEIGEAFNAKTATPAGTVSQWIAAATVMTFVDQGKLKLDDPVAKYLPVFGKYAKGYLTIRHCLSNTTGIESEPGKVGKVFGGRRKFATLEEEVNAIAAKEISNNPEKEFHFGNFGINIAARVVEVIGKKSFDRLAQERITRPLKMRVTSFTDENGGAVNAAAGARSSANDLMSFLIMILNDGRFEGKQILSEKALEEMHTIQFAGLPVKYKPEEATGFDFGLGNWLIDKDTPDAPGIIVFPGSTGTWGIVDRCRKYVAVIFVKKAADEAKQKTFLDLKNGIEEQLPGNCK
ncbi:MAG: class A beta-lactamase-related serine hydrolase [Chitinophagaceae bacterium]|nr:MAG: class A beta-lactamase-related serine hydrolase [Chitinophagaceae bacterium]